MKRTEETLQIQVAHLLQTLGWHSWHTPNEGKRSKRAGGRLKSMGMLAGVSDILIREPWVKCGCKWCVGQHREPTMMIAIELKSSTGDLTQGQEEFLRKERIRGSLTAICRSLDDVIAVLKHARPIEGRRLM